MTELEKVQLAEVGDSLTEFWSQRVVGEANGSLFKVAKGIRSTEWHAHPDYDEVFVVLRGELVLQLRSGDVTVGPGELIVVPRGVEHAPRADDVVHFLIVGPEVTSNASGGKPAWSVSPADAPG